MKGRVSKARAPRSHLEPSKASRLDAIATKSAELPPSHRDRSADFAQATTPLPSSKRQLDAASTGDLLSAKRPRLLRTDAQTRKYSMCARWIEHAKVSGTGPSRGSGRLQTRQHSTHGEGPTRLVQSAPPCEPQAEAGAGSPSLPSKRARPRTNAQQSGIENKEVEAANTVRPTKPPKSPSKSGLEPKVEEQERVSPATPLRDSDGDDNEHPLKRARLTRKNLAQFNRMKKKGVNKASVSAPPETTVESSTKTTSTTTSGFAIQARQNGILPPRLSKPPVNLEEIRERDARPRATASPPESRFELYAHKVESARNEATMVFKAGAHMLKEHDDKSYDQVLNQAFTNFPRDVGFNNGLSAPQPDFIEGLDMEGFRPFPINKHINGATLYKDDPFSLTLPHLAGEWKGRGKDIEKARLQSAYNGAALVYARNQALSYIGKPDPPSYAKVTTFTTDGTHLNLYAHYATPSEEEDGMLEYHQYQYASINIKDSYKGHKEGRRGLRTEQDYARKESYALRDQLKEHWKHRGRRLAEGAPPLPVPNGTLEATNADTDDTGYEEVEIPCQPTPAVTSTKSLPSANDSISSSGGQKRKASSWQAIHESSRRRSKGKTD